MTGPWLLQSRSGLGDIIETQCQMMIDLSWPLEISLRSAKRDHCSCPTFGQRRFNFRKRADEDLAQDVACSSWYRRVNAIWASRAGMGAI